MTLSNLQTRVITGIVFGITFIGSILFSKYSFITIGFFILIVGCFELIRILQTLTIQANRTFLYLTNSLSFIACIYFTSKQNLLGETFQEVLLFITLFIGLIFYLFVSELFRNIPKQIENISCSIFSVFYLGIPLGLLVSCSIDVNGNYVPWNVLFLFFFMWASDTGAYFSGRALGKNKLFERLSPKKTIEGFIGGILASMLVGIAAFYFVSGASLIIWVVIGGVLSVTGTLGDLFESMLKRQARIKDSGTILPGHGGILDRFDSTLLSAPVYWIIMNLIQH